MLSSLPPSLLLLLLSLSSLPPSTLTLAFDLYTTLPDQLVLSATATATSTATTTASVSSPTSVLSGLTLPEFATDLPTSVNWAVWESAEALVDPERGNKLLSVQMKGNWLGYSVEMSVANQVLGPYSNEIRAPFLNFLQNLRSRTQSGARVRVGGNSQEGSYMYDVDGLPARADGKATTSFLQKEDETEAINPTNTPSVLYTRDMVYAMSNISALVNTEWMFGIAFVNNTVENWANPFEVAQFVESYLGDNLMGLQLANEPDLYADRRRDADYTWDTWQSEMQEFFTDVTVADPDLPQTKNWYLPNVCCNWFPSDLLSNLTILDTFANEMKALSWQHYPHDNCENSAGEGQTVLAEYHSHALATNTIAGDLNYQVYNNMAIQRGLEVTMAETNTASCSGYAGVSDAFISALWTLDWSFTLASINFTSAYLHVGGRNAYYNPFTAVQTNLSATSHWTAGPTYYTTLVMAEAFGSTNTSQVVDISPAYDATVASTEQLVNNNFPAYAIYENNVPTKLAFINFVSNIGVSDYDAVINIGGITEGTTRTTPTEVYVRYLRANSTLEMYDIRWAGQTASPNGAASSDGILSGDVETFTVPCDTTALTCTVKVYAPSLALVFLTKEALDASSGVVLATQPADSTATDVTTFPTTYDAQGQGSATVADAALETSNGRGGVGTVVGGTTSKGGTLFTSSGESVIGGASGLVAWGAVVLGMGWLTAGGAL
ncbi:hypothetical protein BDY24DRAFT_389626 [Mrakia frigida]|uniref:glycosyl hydrolase family 79 C-terminal domain-containing protein n=1 Tax=Mrakia frigida TaxID=29902 RepID=UPI003FCC0E70